ncbi:MULTISPECIES: alpha/beta fold hydrolase [unclassified Sphingomonas]|uniref:alpha/beta fold hydrolase n=1 Tax=unclassified Sphingomonas TaxID=196159 RepID=UPI0021511B69|nr:MULTISPECIES: alpha/beta hydrolase [unclassified Sphingomonas]MCR5870975.1 alpha/beta hydrolase [Sphingomonas sp. J344]UUY00702.1 alpha/beta hydrolase [Sphingomonas sp. J315]
MDQMKPAGVLAPYAGAPPPAPAWYRWAIDQLPARSIFECDGVPVELLTWGEVGKPGLLFLHGDSAHADWWSYTAPFFADEWRCAAISWSGMGSSGRRPDYTFDAWAREAIAAIDAAALDNGTGTMVVAHSLGGYPALIASAREPRIRGIVSLDSAIIPQDLMAEVPRPKPRPHKVYASEQEALGRFRFMPPTIGDQHYAVDHIARRGLHEAEGGWTWRFDPEIWRDLESRSGENLADLPRRAKCPLALIVGERSELIRDEIATYMRGIYPAGTPFIGIPDAGHHIMADQPLALIAALRSCFAYWPERTP